MNLKPQPPVTRRASRPKRASPASRPRGRGARRPGVPLRKRVGARLPSMRRILAGVGAVAAAAVLVALLNGPWLRVTSVASAGERYADPDDLDWILGSQRGVSVLAVDTEALRARLERIAAVESATVNVSLTGSVEAMVVEHEAAFVWETRSGQFLGARDGTIFAGGRDDESLATEAGNVPHIRDERFAARLITVGDTIPADLLRIGLRLGEIDPAVLGSSATALSVQLDDEYGYRLVSSTPAWEVAFGVYGLDPRETAAEADARLGRQITAVRTLFASRPEAGIGWVDVRNPGKVYFRAKG